MATNPKSDSDAKIAFASELRKRGYDQVSIIRRPADISAFMNGEQYYFEIKYTGQDQRYFGAATLTEWEAAIVNEDRFMFVVAAKRKGNWIFHEYTPKEFMEFSYIPPFKIFFNVPVGVEKAKGARPGSTSVSLTADRIREMLILYKKFRISRSK